MLKEENREIKYSIFLFNCIRGGFTNIHLSASYKQPPTYMKYVVYFNDFVKKLRGNFFLETPTGFN